ncbi:O-methyltransferase [Psychrobacter vallis]|uniref:O-methyltransferase n=1 Tax=Psychrobacter vallis TaxID=248451 RepID=UPI001918962F|nr:class I SAM-dependent methyltransferase [Psychrobacter vallis]
MTTHKSFEPDYFLSYCQSLYDTDKVYDTEQTNRFDRHRHVEPDSAEFLAGIAIMRNANKVLEIGTSTGFSTLWLAYGLRYQSDINFISLDIDKSRSDTAKKHLKAVGLSSLVDVKVQDAFDFLNQNSEIFDLIFLDAERQFYCDYIEQLHKALSLGSVLIVDNVLSHDDEVREFLAAFKNNSRYICRTLDIGAGLFMAVCQEP